MGKVLSNVGNIGAGRCRTPVIPWAPPYTPSLGCHPCSAPLLLLQALHPRAHTANREQVPSSLLQPSPPARAPPGPVQEKAINRHQVPSAGCQLRICGRQINTGPPSRPQDQFGASFVARSTPRTNLDRGPITARRAPGEANKAQDTQTSWARALFWFSSNALTKVS